MRVLKAGWSGLYIPRTFGRGVVPPTFAGLNTQRHRWCFGGMQILRLHWRSLMPWDRSPDNHLTIAQRRDYLMACLSWLRDLLMLGFSILLLIVTALVVTGSNFVLMPLGGNSPLLPMSLIIVATVCMTWTQRHWTTISWRRAGMALVISLSAAWITALACVQGLTHREGVFLRTKKKGADKRPIRTALRLTRVETLLAISLYACFGLLLDRQHPPYILVDHHRQSRPAFSPALPSQRCGTPARSAFRDTSTGPATPPGGCAGPVAWHRTSSPLVSWARSCSRFPADWQSRRSPRPASSPRYTP